MNSKSVLSKIAKLLNLETVELTYAKLADGTIVESPTFDVGEDLFVVSEDGTKSPAPNGFHDLMLKDEEGNENLIKVRTEDGKIVERENVELAEVEDKKTEALPGDPGTGFVDPSVKEVKVAGKPDEKLKPSSMMAAEEVEVGELPQTDGEELPSLEDVLEEGEGELVALKKKFEDMVYRIEEMEKKIKEMADVKVEEISKKPTEDVKLEEEELPKLDGAPLEEGVKFSTEENKKRFGKRVENPQAKFLSKLYK